MSSIELQAVEKWFGATQVVKGVDLAIEEGELVIFVGPSGCGKSTLLRLIAGLEEISRGQLLVGGQDMTADPPSKRGLAMVFQSYALYPHMSVRDNMGFSLKTAGSPKAEIAEKVDQVAGALRLDALLDRLPKELSGGQRQRVAIGRAIVREPTAFLFDEPLSNLDAALRVEMRHEIARLHARLGVTMIYVTHDQVEAMTLADRIVVLRDGRIEQVGAPRDLYDNPANLFVAQFIGSPKMNVAACATDGASWRIAGGGGAFTGRASHLGVRPEHIRLVEAGAGHLTGIVEVYEYLGADCFLVVNTGDTGEFTVRQPNETRLRVNDRVGLAFDEDRLFFFGEDGARAYADGEAPV